MWYVSRSTSLISVPPLISGLSIDDSCCSSNMMFSSESFTAKRYFSAGGMMSGWHFSSSRSFPSKMRSNILKGKKSAQTWSSCVLVTLWPICCAYCLSALCNVKLCCTQHAEGKKSAQIRFYLSSLRVIWPICWAYCTCNHCVMLQCVALNKQKGKTKSTQTWFIHFLHPLSMSRYCAYCTCCAA